MPCVEWRGPKTHNGYGTATLTVAGRRVVRVHRAIYIAMHGPIPDEMMVLHRCDNRACINPAHLYLGTAQDNADDCGTRGRRRQKRDFRRRRLTHCKHGHALSGGNIYIAPKTGIHGCLRCRHGYRQRA